MPRSKFYHKTKKRIFARCKECMRPALLESMHDRIDAARTVSDDLKKGPCTDCGKHFPPIAMDFDHLPHFPKKKSIAALVRAGNTRGILEEVKKCELVCACCHRIRTAQRALVNPHYTPYQRTKMKKNTKEDAMTSL